ncbi:radical SAM protein [Desulfovibrio ferrophilus]|uniref:Radical SAM domain protein n=1 Tax=Desulfovibrio ferrophilus TaxID=241368 RepID=A0A2Z6B162_9BACT|nr:radical SAM protein [Desulfovibrio ferrophilus]BBD09241.1 radical SAM domain protein [Desulfovibrio ferrophilus]
MLNGVHILLSYTCLYQCDHCFLHCSPGSEGAFSLAQFTELLDQAAALKTVRKISIEGGEPFLFYPIMLRGIEYAHKLGFETEVISNGYWAQDSEDAKAWLKPLVEAGLSTLNVSDDELHHGEASPSPAKAALQAAQELGIAQQAFTIESPKTIETTKYERGRGAPIVGGGVRFRGRAVEKLTNGLPLTYWREFTECTDEDFGMPGRVHIDAYGHVQLCQGISIGNVWERPLAEVMSAYNPEDHPICGPLMQGGPTRLAQKYGLDHKKGFSEGYVDACHLCYQVRKALLDTFPIHLAPLQAYGA